MGGGDGDSALPQPDSSRGAMWPWLALTLLVPVAFAVVVIALNSSVYSAGGFVSRYLDALARKDIAVALETPGVVPPAGASTAALRREALSGLGDHRIVADVDEGGGTHRITAEYGLGGSVRRGEFVVRGAAPAFVVFQGWRFAESPVAQLHVTVLHDSGFRINGYEWRDGATVRDQRVVDLAVLSPAAVVLDQESRYLRAEPVPVTLDDARNLAEATVDVRANDAFRQAVQTEVNSFLGTCAAQHVLQPAGCPFRRVLDDRVLEAPAWSIVSYPRIGIEPGIGDDGVFGWFVPPTPGTAHIVVKVVSLFDGTVSVVDEDVQFTVLYRIAIREDGGLDLRAG